MSRTPAEKRLLYAGLLIVVGLLVQAASLWGNGAVAFLVFGGVGLVPVAAGILLYGWTLLARADG